MCDIINFLIFSCLVLVKPVVNAWLIVYAYMFLCDDFYSTHMDNFTSFIRRRPVITNMCQIMMPSKFLKPEESSKLLQDQHFKTHVLSDYIYFTPHPRPRWDPRTPDWSKKTQYFRSPLWRHVSNWLLYYTCIIVIS